MQIEAPSVALTDTQLATVRSIVGRLLPDGQVWIFGSRATGRARPFSDLDLLVTEPRQLSWGQRAALRDAFEASDLPFCVDLVEADGLAPAVAARVFSERVPLGPVRAATV